MRTPLLAMLLTSLFALGACTMPGGAADDARLEAGAEPQVDRDAGAGTRAEAPADVKPGAAPIASETPAPPMSQPLPPVAAPGAVDRSCRTDADCAVKNVGNCCGAMPACVNKGANPDPAAVQAQCQREGMSSICGFKDIQSCSCVAGTCQDAGGGAVTQ